MALVYLIRHALSQDPTKKIWQGPDIDSPLIPEGKKQSILLAYALFKIFQADHILSSPLIRAYQTAEPYAALLHKKIQKLEELTERNLGLCSGKSNEEIQTLFPTFYQDWIKNPLTAVIPGGESQYSLQQRLQPLVNRIQKSNESYAIFSHYHIIQIMYKMFMQESNNDIPLKIFNATVTALDVDQNKGILLRYNEDIAHLYVK